MYQILIEIVLFAMFVMFFVEKKNAIVFLDRTYTDTLRGIAIIFVILMHSSCDVAMRVFTPLGGVGVAIFLILSGYGLTLSYKKSGLKGFLQKKIKRIWIPYFIFLILYYLCRKNIGDIFSIQFLLDASLLKPSFWFIGFLVFNYLLFYFCFKYDCLYKRRYIIFFIIGIIIFLFDHRIRAEQILSFPLGIFLAEYYQQIRKSMRMVFYGAIMLFLISSLLLLLKQIPDIREALNNNDLLVSVQF